jgi:cytochrome c553
MTGGAGKTIPCAICHGQGLKGLGEVPAIANRTPVYLFRQLNDMKTGMRSGMAAALMTATVEKLTVADMIALSAYAGSLEP